MSKMKLGTLHSHQALGAPSPAYHWDLREDGPNCPVPMLQAVLPLQLGGKKSLSFPSDRWSPPPGFVLASIHHSVPFSYFWQS